MIRVSTQGQTAGKSAEQKAEEKAMQHELAVDFGAGVENRGWGAGDPAFRCGLPFRGNGRPIRNDGPWAKLPASMAAGSLVEVSWGADASWRKKIQVSKE